MTRGNRKPAYWPAIVFLLTRAPRTLRDLSKLTGASENAVHGALKKLEAEGLAEVAGPGPKSKPNARGTAPNLWRWVPWEPIEAVFAPAPGVFVEKQVVDIGWTG